jgi:hypothetical protein
MSESWPRVIKRGHDPVCQMEMLLYHVIAMFVVTRPGEGEIPEGLVVEIAEFLDGRTPLDPALTDAAAGLARFIGEHTPTR